MIDQIFFTTTDVRKIRHISIHIDDFDMYAQEVQRNFVNQLLGDDLYDEFINDLDGSGVPQSQRFIDLLDGKTYEKNGVTRIYRGLKLYASYLWLYVYSLDSGAKVTPTGTRIFKDDESEDAQSKQEFRQLRDHSIRSANGLEDGIIDYLREFASTYPEYNSSDKVEPADENDFSFKTIGGTFNNPTNKFY
jgi:hypothetical protein